MYHGRQTRSNSNFNEKNCRLGESSLIKYFRKYLFDSELSKSRKNANFFKIYTKDASNKKRSTKQLFLKTQEDEPKYPCQNNVMHIIQHPSWRINIKQQQPEK